MAIGKEGNVKWVDGLRGIASALVVLTHIARSFDVDLFSSLDAKNAPPRTMQLPYLRILIQGRIGVTIFAFVTGYVCALKPLKLCKANNQEAAFAAISKSALRRIPRLFLPGVAATVISFIVSESTLYTIAKNTDSWWIDTMSPAPRKTFVKGLKSLFYNIGTTWTKSSNRYDQNQWTLLPLVKGSILVYAFLVATAYVKPRYRMAMSFGWFVYYWCCADAVIGMQVFWGVLIAEMQNLDMAGSLIRDHPRFAAFSSTCLLFIGLTFASFPEKNPEWTDWSQSLVDFMKPIMPKKADLPRFGSGIGLEFITLGIVLSPFLQKLLSSRPLLFLGRMSFAVYLLHGTLIKTMMAWMVYGVKTLPRHQDEHGKVVITRLQFPGYITLLAWQVVWLPMLYGIAYAWMAYVDPWCEKITNKMVERVKLEASEKPPVLPVQMTAMPMTPMPMT